jgi:hypothetical protein
MTVFRGVYSRSSVGGYPLLAELAAAIISLKVREVCYTYVLETVFQKHGVTPLL